MANPNDTIRDLLLSVAPPALAAAGRRLVTAEAALAEGADGIAYAEALTNWGDLGGYDLEARWAAAARRSIKSPVDDVATRRIGQLSGGERKRLLLDVLVASDAEVLLLDEPDNNLDIPTRAWLEEQLAASKATILLVSHDRTLLERSATKVVSVEGSGAWVHGGSYATYPEARRRRQEQLGDALTRWRAEERRLFRHMKIMKQRAAVNFKTASKADAAEPTDNLDIDSSEALEWALDRFQGTVLAVSHDRTFLSTLDRFWLLADDLEVWELPDADHALRALTEPGALDGMRLARRLTTV